MSTAVAQDVSKLAGKYLTFRLANEEYGIEILKVREIIGMQQITAVPRMPVFMKGVINLRGRIIPVLDLRLKFSFEELDYSKETCIIVVSIDEVMLGVIVDTVSEVIDIPASEIEESPSFGGEAPTEFIMGMGKMKERVIILLNVDRILSSKEMERIDEFVS